MKKALIISFFKSNNIGDLALSSAISNIVNSYEYQVVKYDFSTIERINSPIDEIKEETLPIPVPKGISKMIKRLIIRIILLVLGKYLFGYLAIFLKRKNWKNFISDLKNSDTVVVGGGNMMMDKQTFWPALLHYYCFLSNKYNKKVHIMFIGAEPPESLISRHLFKNALKYVSSISVRDPVSRDICQRLTSKNVFQSIDPVFALRPQISSPSKRGKVDIAVCVLSGVCFKDDFSFSKYLDGLSRILKKVLKNQSVSSLTLFSTDTADYNTVDQVHKIMNDNGFKNVHAFKPKGLHDIYSLYQNVQYLIGGRMHAMIIAQKCLLPYCGVIWQSKVKGFALVVNNSERLFELEDFEDTDHLSSLILSDINNINILKVNMKLTNMRLEQQVNINIFL